MSRIIPTVVDCPRCGAGCPARVFESLNGDALAVQVDAILDGSFERMTCSRCDAAFQPEHEMLFARHSARLWIVMYPFRARAEHAALEAAVADIVARNFAEAPAGIAGDLQTARPRLVFGQYALAEAVRSARDALDPPLLECAKLLAYRRSLAQLFSLGPVELVYERLDADHVVFGVRALATAERLGELAITGEILAETQQQLPQLAHSHRALFERPYISALRYLDPAPVPDAP